MNDPHYHLRVRRDSWGTAHPLPNRHAQSGTPAQDIFGSSSSAYPHGHYAVPFVLAAILYLSCQPLLWNCIKHWIRCYARFCQHFGNWNTSTPIAPPPPLCPSLDHSDLEETRILILEHTQHFIGMLVTGLLLGCILPGAGCWRATADCAFQLLVATTVLPFVLAVVVPLRLSVGPVSFWAALARSLGAALCRASCVLVACIPFRTILAVGAAVLSWQAIGPYAVEALLQQLIWAMWWASYTMEGASIRMEHQALAMEELSYSWTS